MRKSQKKKDFFSKRQKKTHKKKSTEIVKRATIMLVKLGSVHLHLSKDHE